MHVSDTRDDNVTSKRNNLIFILLGFDGGVVLSQNAFLFVFFVKQTKYFYKILSI